MFQDKINWHFEHSSSMLGFNLVKSCLQNSPEWDYLHLLKPHWTLTAINYTLLKYIPGKGSWLLLLRVPDVNGVDTVDSLENICDVFCEWNKLVYDQAIWVNFLSGRESRFLPLSLCVSFLPWHICQKQWVQRRSLNFLSIPVQVIAVDVLTHWRGRYYLPLSTNIVLFAIPWAGPNSSPVRSELRKAGRDI